MENIGEVKAELNELRERVEKLEEALQNEPTAKLKSSLRSLLQSFAPSSHNERALAIGYYLEKVEGRSGFTSDDLREGYIKGKIPLPANLSDVIAKTGKKGWAMTIDEEDHRKVWQITAEGERIVEQRIEDEA